MAALENDEFERYCNARAINGVVVGWTAPMSVARAVEYALKYKHGPTTAEEFRGLVRQSSAVATRIAELGGITGGETT